jgi:RimJ/RimL family protein N-acetyltransferase
MAAMPQLFSDNNLPEPERLATLLMRRDAVFFDVYQDEEDVGLIYFTDITVGHQAIGHIMFWDKKLRGREDIALASIQVVMRDFQLVRVASIIPSWNKAALKFAEKIGMTLEGVARRATISRGEFRDLHLYSILKEEMEDGRLSGRDIRRGAGDADVDPGADSETGPGTEEGEGAPIEVPGGIV